MALLASFRERQGWTRLHETAFVNDVNLAVQTIEESNHYQNKDSVVYCVDSENETPLHHATSQEMVEVLLSNLSVRKRVEFIRHCNKQGHAALHKAAENKEEGIALAIIWSCDHKFRHSIIFSIDGYGRTPLHWTESSRLARLMLLNLPPELRTKFIKHRDKGGQTALHRATEGNNVHIVKEIIRFSDPQSRGSVIYSVDSEGKTPMHDTYSREIAELLLANLTPHNKQMLIRHRNRAGQTCLHKAAMRDRVAIADLIINTAEDCNRDSTIYCVDNSGKVPLHCAESSNMVDLLLSKLSLHLKQQFLTHSNKWGRTALHAAAESGNVAVAEAIIKSATGATNRDSVIYCLDHYERTPLHWTRSPAIARLLIFRLSFDLREQFVRHRNRRGQTPLHSMVESDSIDAARIVVHSVESQSRDSLIFSIDDDGMTPLFEADSSDIASLLLDNLSDQSIQRFIRHRNRFGQTAADEAAFEGYHGVMQVIKSHSDLVTFRDLLFNHDKHGNTLLLRAGYHGNKNTIRLLRKHMEGLDDEDVEALIRASSCYGETIIHLLVVHQLVNDAVKILRMITIERRRKILAVENSMGYSSQRLAGIPPGRIRRSGSVRYGLNITDYIIPDEVSNQLLKCLHRLTNEYGFTIPASIIQYELSRRTLCHRQLSTDEQTSVITVRTYTSHMFQL